MLGRAEKVATLTPIAAHAADATISYEKGTLTLTLAVQPEAPHRFIGLRLAGTQTGEASIADVHAAIRSLPGKNGVVLTRLDTHDAPPPAAIDTAGTPALVSGLNLCIHP